MERRQLQFGQRRAVTFLCEANWTALQWLVPVTADMRPVALQLTKLSHKWKTTSRSLTFGYRNSLIWMCMEIKGQQMENFFFNFLPNKVSLSILLHWMAKDRSELSKIVMRSSSKKGKDCIMTMREIISTKEYILSVKYTKNPTNFIYSMEVQYLVNMTWSRN